MPVPPKRDSERRRTNTPSAEKAPLHTDEKLGPELPEELKITGIGKLWYESLRTSGQAIYYTDSDWSSAWFIAQAMSDYMSISGMGRGSLLTGILRGMSQLMVTEGERRKARLELERNPGQEDPNEVSAAADFASYQKRIA